MISTKIKKMRLGIERETPVVNVRSPEGVMGTSMTGVVTIDLTRVMTPVTRRGRDLADLTESQIIVLVEGARRKYEPIPRRGNGNEVLGR